MLFMDLIDGELLNTETDLTVDKVDICLKYLQSQRPIWKSYKIRDVVPIFVGIKY
jgi:hypothetical protein